MCIVMARKDLPHLTVFIFLFLPLQICGIELGQRPCRTECAPWCTHMQSTQKENNYEDLLKLVGYDVSKSTKTYKSSTTDAAYLHGVVWLVTL
jgi:hypothetical protein